MSPSVSTRFFTLFSKKMSLHHEEDEDNKSILTTSTGISTKSDMMHWYYCQDCKIGFASQIRLHWHTDLCKNRESL